jgi:hypothetical protein
MEEAESQAGKWQRLLESGLRKRAEFCMVSSLKINDLQTSESTLVYTTHASKLN